MYCTRKVTDDLIWVGADDRRLPFFEGVYGVPDGVSYNSYLLLDEKTVLFDTVDKAVYGVFLENVAHALGGRGLDYLIIHHMEPDHSANIAGFLAAYPGASVVATAQAFRFMEQFYGVAPDKRVVVKDRDALCLGRHELTFFTAPMVHWPEVMFTYDRTDAVLFSADAFGKFGALDYDDPEGWACEARRYYFGIVGKYGAQVQAVLKKLAGLDIRVICPLHGPVLTEDIGYYLATYDTWSSYGVESEGVAICYTSVYGHTKEAALRLAEKLKALGCPKVAVTDLAREDMHEAVEDAFRYGRLVLASTTYDAGVFPIMKDFIDRLAEHNYQNRRIGLIENGSWAPAAAKTMKALLADCKNIAYTETTVTLRSALRPENDAQLDALAAELLN